MKEEATRARINAIKVGRPPTRSVSSASEVYTLMSFLEHADREIFYILHLDVKNKVLGMEKISKGTLTNSLLHQREIFKGAVISNSARIICVHNHPSGDPNPSREDELITARIIQAGKILGIEILDHVIVGAIGRFYSMQAAGFMGFSLYGPRCDPCR